MATGTPNMVGTPNMGAPGGTSSEPRVDLMNIEWRFQEWLMGMGGLNPDNVLDYFALSPFWDPECNNAVLKMQTQFNNLGEMKQRLSEMTGVEFALVHERYPSLYIIQKQRRRSPQEVKPMALYYVLHGNIFQCPDLHTLICNRVLGSLFHVESAFDEARNMSEFHPSSGYSWKSVAAPGTTQEGSSSVGGGGIGGIGGVGSSGTGTSTPSLAASSLASRGQTAAKAESQDFRIAVDRAIKNVEQRAHLQQIMQQTGTNTPGTAATGVKARAGSGVDTKVKQEGTSSAPAAASKSTPKTATKRRKKGDETSVAGSNMGINTSAGAGSGATGARSASSGGPTTPSTPGATPAKKRKKSKAADAK
ncbi:Mediator of RNA polymerase II transcription subunit 6 [Lunasporangiospora selenospora]|uniref:Mediator of RNA polymerase II transcription subunit 6 n=1 Tax=Lunasporangiospora selenospora TaxID=979761 RepID=A0A9P6FVI3_9FUNG|nr:Mediator of RNA polymerase II transcription subunit 6 [Lunasporangiospora selenospora]